MIVLTNGCPVKIGRVVSENPNAPTPYGQKKSKPLIFRDLAGDQTVARRPSHGSILLNELKANVGVYLRFG
jgi:hypothetical protein